MPQDEQYEWPSFETVLRDVATSDVSSPSTDPAPAVGQAPVSSEQPAAESLSELHVEPTWSEASVDDVSSTVEIADDDDLLPAPLAPLDFDTSAVRALLEPRKPSTDETFDLDALEPLAPPSTLDIVEEPVEYADLSADAFEPDSVALDEPDSVFDLAFQPDDYLSTDETDAPEIDAFSDTPILEDVEGIELPQSPDAQPEVLSIDELPSGMVFELDETTLIDVEGEAAAQAAPVEEFSVPTIDLFDLQETSEEVEADRIDEFGEDLYGSGLIDQLSTDDSAGTFDSIATANAIEGELNELNDLAALEPDFEVEAAADPSENLYHLDNVFPIRPEPSEGETADLLEDFADDEKGVPPSPPSGPSPARISHTGWVGLDNVDTPQPVVEDDPDPWAHMRPEDEPAQQGFWAKVFGGDERKKARARRLAQNSASEAESTPESAPSEGVSFDSACPNCGSQCQVDLDDPIGQRVHVSCPSCDHMWNTPYINATG